MQCYSRNRPEVLRGNSPETEKYRVSNSIPESVIKGSLEREGGIPDEETEIRIDACKPKIAANNFTPVELQKEKSKSQQDTRNWKEFNCRSIISKFDTLDKIHLVD